MRSTRKILSNNWSGFFGVRLSRIRQQYVLGVREYSKLQGVSESLGSQRAVRQSLDDNMLIICLRQYIPKNKKITAFMHDVDINFIEHESHLSELYSAIRDGDFEAKIFEHEHCLRYLLYLIESDKIPYWQGMTAYSYVMAFAQFTDRQSLGDSDKRFKSMGYASVFSLVDNGQITGQGMEYLSHVVEYCRCIDVEIDFNDLVDFIGTLPPSEQTVLKISYNRNARDDVDEEAADRIVAIIANNIPYCRDVMQNYCNLPSLSIINYLHMQMSPVPLQMKPIFGTVSLDELQKLHGFDQHPVAYYHPDVQSNLVRVHERNCGPFPALLHDIAHVFLANMLSENERSILYSSLIPIIEKVWSECKCDDMKNMLGQVHYRLNDYNLTHINCYKNKNRRFLAHVERIFREEIFGSFSRIKFYFNPEHVETLMKIQSYVKVEANKDHSDIFWTNFNVYLECMLGKSALFKAEYKSTVARFT